VEFVRWADRVNADRDRALEFEEILGYHLEQAHRCLRELGPLDEAAQAIGIDAARRLGTAGRRAFARSDMHAAANLMQRAAALLPEDHASRRAMLPELGEALMELGDFEAARAWLDQAATLASRAGDVRIAHAAALGRMFVRLYGGEPGEWGAQALQLASDAAAALAPHQADNELAIAWRLKAFVHGVAGRYQLAGEAMTQQIHYARAAGNLRLVARGGLGMANVVLPGHTPVAEAIGHCDRILLDVASDRQVQSIVRCIQAQLHAMNGEFDKARAMVRRGRHDLNDLGQGVMRAATAIDLARVELLAGDASDAEREIRADYEFLTRRGETYLLSSIAAALGRLVRQQGRDDEALHLSQAAESAAAEDDVDAQVQWRAVRAPILARGGDAVAAQEMARSALHLARAAEAPLLQADALIDLGEVLEVAQRTAQARECYLEAGTIAAAKGDVVTARRARARAARPQAPPVLETPVV
jgi:tetratricopeptide (TPR) repeat protein